MKGVHAVTMFECEREEDARRASKERPFLSDLSSLGSVSLSNIMLNPPIDKAFFSLRAEPSQPLRVDFHISPFPRHFLKPFTTFHTIINSIYIPVFLLTAKVLIFKHGQ